VVRLAHGQPIAGGEIADASRREHAEDLGHQTLCFRDMFVNVGAEGGIEAIRGEVELQTILQLKGEVRAAEI
jgi:hypothetical protein